MTRYLDQVAYMVGIAPHCDHAPSLGWCLSQDEREGAQVSGFRVQDSGLRVQGTGFRVWGLGIGVQGPWSRV